MLRLNVQCKYYFNLNTMTKVIIDTDPGVDDALALIFSCYSHLKVQAITTIYGNSSVENSTRNALTILNIINKDIRLHFMKF